VSSGFSAHDITRMLGVPAGRLRAYVKAGLLCPQRGDSGELRFSFQDLLLMRTAEGLVTERLPPHRIRSALVSLRGRLPPERPLTGVQLGAVGGHVVVHDDGRAWHADSGQVLLSFAEVPGSSGPFELGSDGTEPRRSAPTGVLAPFDRPRKSDKGKSASAGRPAAAADLQASLDAAATLVEGPDGPALEPTAADLYQLGCNLEEVAPEAARVAYQRALTLEPDFAEAHVNLGRLMHESGDLPFAEEHYRAALALRPGDATAQFNLGVVLEDRGRFAEALAMYEATVITVPNHADAHFNAARLYDRGGNYEAALRHLRTYKSLTEA
jgi:tetratricopeptide (TPR) repeat protein